MEEILSRYAALLALVDDWFSTCIARAGSAIACKNGCAECCRGLFDITLLDACYLKAGFDRLEAQTRKNVLTKAKRRLLSLQFLWPEYDAPYILNYRPEEEWEVLMPDDDETPCTLLSSDGTCLVYEYRPMTCRLHGLPLVDISGEVMHDEWCTRNFTGKDPLEMDELRWGFNKLFREELLLFRRFTNELFGQSVNELDSFIPTALLIDFKRFPWRKWRKANPLPFQD
ncbi:MAG TPA: YkgJ family cysteine cluster protein [Geobacteraceae bacterium]|nr:YkgJ family cysteine cluster protein [Geobacteraceae bacterium]